MHIKTIKIRQPKEPKLKDRQKAMLLRMLHTCAAMTGHVEASPDVYACVWFSLGHSMSKLPPLSFEGMLNGRFFKLWRTDTGGRVRVMQPLDSDWIKESEADLSWSRGDALQREADANRKIRDGQNVFGRKGLF